MQLCLLCMCVCVQQTGTFINSTQNNLKQRRARGSLGRNVCFCPDCTKLALSEDPAVVDRLFCSPSFLGFQIMRLTRRGGGGKKGTATTKTPLLLYVQPTDSHVLNHLPLEE